MLSYVLQLSCYRRIVTELFQFGLDEWVGHGMCIHRSVVIAMLDVFHASQDEGRYVWGRRANVSCQLVISSAVRSARALWNGTGVSIQNINQIGRAHV